MSILTLVLAAATAQAPVVISADRIREDVRILASDDFEGRGPGEVGEQRTVEYLSRAFAAAGLEPGGADGSWVQKVPLVRLDRLPGAALSLTVGGKAMPLAIGEQATLALRNAGRTDVANAPLVFGGYGVVDAARDGTRTPASTCAAALWSCWPTTRTSKRARTSASRAVAW